MRRTALGILLAGFVFVFVSIPVAGIDVLLDPVGFLLAFNATRALQKLERFFSVPPVCCIVLVIISTLQLFFTTGITALGLAVLQAVGQAVLYAALAYGFYKMLRDKNRRAEAVLMPVLFLWNIAGVGFSALFPAQWFGNIFLGCARIFLLLALFWLAIVLKDTNV